MFFAIGLMAGASAAPSGSAAPQAPLAGEIMVSDDTTMWRVRASGGGARNVPLPLPKETSYYVSDVAWSPNGRRIAFAYGPDPDHHDLWIANRDGRNPRRLVRGEPLVSGYSPDWPVWAPDGSRIAYNLSAVAGGEIWIFDLRTGRESKIPNVSASYLVAWSKSNTIWFRRRDGSGISKVRPNGTGKSAIPNTRDAYDLSPDEQHLLGEDSSKGVFVVRADGSQRTQLALPPNAHGPTWGPDSRSIAFFRATGLWAKELRNGALHHISPRRIKGEFGSFDWTAGS
jgi:Tol biopolymer transport system component